MSSDLNARRSTRRIPALSALLSVAVIATGALSGCSSTTVQGNALRDPRVDGKAVIPGLLNPGNYPTKPLPPIGNAGDAFKGSLAEARRMSEFVVMPFEVDPELVNNGSFSAGVLKKYEVLSLILPESMVKNSDHKPVAAFNAVASTPGEIDTKTGKWTGGPYKSLENVVMRFATPEEATAAANDLAARAVSVRSRDDQPADSTQPIAIPRHPEAKAVTYKPSDHHLVMSFTAHGPYLLIELSGADASPQTAADIIATALDKQTPLIDTFQATPVDKLPELPLDPDGVLAKTLPADKESATVNDGVFGPHGTLTFASTPARDQKVLTEAGVDVVARSDGSVTRTRDAAAAEKVASEYADEVKGMGLTPRPSVPGLPASACFTSPGKDGELSKRYYCVTPVDRYVVEISSPKEVVAHQKSAAQYLMLTAQ